MIFRFVFSIPAALFAFMLFTLTATGQSPQSGQAAAPFGSTDAGPLMYQQAIQSVFRQPAAISYAAIPGANSYALYTGSPFSMFTGRQPDWLQSQYDSSKPTSSVDVSQPDFVSETEILTAINVRGRSVRLSFLDETVPSPPVARPLSLPAAPELPQAKDGKSDSEKKDSNKDKLVLKRYGRIVLNKNIVFSGWKKNSLTKPKNEKNSKSDTKALNDDDSSDLPEKPPTDSQKTTDGDRSQDADSTAVQSSITIPSTQVSP